MINPFHTFLIWVIGWAALVLLFAYITHKVNTEK